MRFQIHVRTIRALLKATAFVSLAGALTACSNDASRLDELITASVDVTPNQSKIIKTKPSYHQPYPGDVSTQRDGIRVLERQNKITPPATPVVVAKPIVQAGLPKVNPPSVPAPGPLTAPVKYDPSQPIVLKPRKVPDNPLRVAGVDTVTTSSVPVQTPVVPQPAAKPVGWASKKGTMVRIREGETLYNLSRRYGVPVQAIMKANDITDANAVQANSQVLIPVYNYASTAPVSAPDNDPVTRVSRSSRGFQGQARGRIAVPKRRASVPVPDVPVLKTPQRKVPNVASYVVQPGDTLYGIARKTGSSVSAIKASNNMTTDVVRVGQKLSLGQSVAGIDPTVTHSVPRHKLPNGQKPPVKTKDKLALLKESKPKAVIDAPSKVGSFRWPAEGRLISRFGERRSTGTNDGIDISVPEGTPVKAAESGVVIYSGSELEDFGKLILVSHKGGWVSAYAHASSALVRRGQKVTRGQVIAKSGKTGNATVPKLHFELRKDSNPVNPLKHLVR